MSKPTGVQNSALLKIERMDKGTGVPLPKVTGDALVRRGLAVEVHTGRYSLPKRPRPIPTCSHGTPLTTACGPCAEDRALRSTLALSGDPVVSCGRQVPRHRGCP